jgi:hypothetical protein
MSVIKKFQDVTKVLNELSTAAISARSEVEQLYWLSWKGQDVQYKLSGDTCASAVSNVSQRESCTGTYEDKVNWAMGGLVARQ